MKMYLNDFEKQNLNKDEEETMKVSLQRCVHRFINNLFLFNKAIKYDPYLLNNVVLGNKEIDSDEVYQYYLTNLNEWDIERFQELEKQLKAEGKEFPLTIAESEELDNYVLLIDKFGLSWDYISSDIDITFNYEEADI